jgi:hypothetical protein
MTAEQGVLLHGEWWDVTALDETTRREMCHHIEALEEMDVCRSSTTGADVDDKNALIVLIVLDGFDALDHYRSQPLYKSMAEYIGPLGLYPDKMVQFNLEMPADAPSLSAGGGLVLHGCQVDASSTDDPGRAEIIERMHQLAQLEVVQAGTAGLDLLAADAISQAVFLDGVEALQRCRHDERYRAMTSSISSRQLPSVSFSLELRGAPW